MLGYLALIDLSEEDERLLDIDWVKITKAPVNYTSKCKEVK